jgi:hypothetical protein
MHVDVHRPERIRLAIRGQEARERATRRLWLELVVRGLATGFGVGLLVMAGAHAAVAEIAVIGVIAIGAALLSWDR